MGLIYFSVMLVCLYLGTSWGLQLWIKRQSDEQLPVKLPAAVASFLLSAFMIGLVGCHMIFFVPKLSVYTLIACLAVAVLFLSAKWPECKKIWVPIVCAAGPYILHRLFPALPITWGTYMLMAVAWMSVMSLVMFFDTLPLLSFFTIATWAFAFATVILIDGIIPPGLAVICWLAVVPLVAIIRVSSIKMSGRLGPYASAFLGFLMGSIIATCIGFKAYSSALAMTSYYLFEGFFFVLAWIGFHPMGMQKGDFIYMVALQKGNPMRVLKNLFYHLIILALLAVLAWQNPYVGGMILLLAIILLHTYDKFKLCNKPEVTVRQLWRDTKESVKTLWRQKGLKQKTVVPSEKDKKETAKKNLFIRFLTKQKGKRRNDSFV